MKPYITSTLFLLIMSVLTGIAYPLLVTELGAIFFHDKASGSLIQQAGEIVGSELIGQNFHKPIYFWPRPSAIGYAPIPSGASNLSATSEPLHDQVETRIQLWQGDLADATPPADLLFASGSGLDPHISPEGALYQLDRVANARHLTADQTQQLKNLIYEMTEDRFLGILGEPVVNVLRLNMALNNKW